MLLTEIKPFIRFARYIDINNEASYPKCKPYDARFFYVYSGMQTIKVENNDIELKKGDILLISPGIEYCIQPTVNEAKLIGINFDYTYSHSYIKDPVAPDTSISFDESKIIEKQSFEDYPALNGYVCIKNIDFLERKLEKIIKEYKREFIHYELIISSIFTEVLTECIRKLKMNNSGNNYNKKIYKDILDYIGDNYNLHLTNKEIGKIFGFHPNYVSELIKKLTGMPLHRYILRLRIIHSIEILETNSMSISEIAEKCGFCDIYYFSRYFKQITKVSPSDYIKKREL